MPAEDSGNSPARTAASVYRVPEDLSRDAEGWQQEENIPAVYFAAVGGAGALLSKCIKSSQVIAYDDLGTEAIRRLEVENMPVIVVIDKEGNYLYDETLKKYRKV